MNVLFCILLLTRRLHNFSLQVLFFSVLILFNTSSLVSAAPHAFFNPYGKIASELVISPTSGALTLGWNRNAGEYHEIKIPVPVQSVIEELSFDAKAVITDEVITLVEYLEFSQSGLPPIPDIEVRQDEFETYLGINGPPPGGSGFEPLKFSLRVENGDLFLRFSPESNMPQEFSGKYICFEDIHRSGCFGSSTSEPVPVGFDPANPQSLEFGEVIRINQSKCVGEYRWEKDGQRDYQITDGQTLLHDGFIIGLWRKDINLGLELCGDHDIDHYYLSFAIEEVAGTRQLSSKLVRFGRSIDGFLDRLIVGLPDTPIETIDHLLGINAQDTIRYQTSAEFVNRLNALKALLVDNGSGLVEVPLRIITDAGVPATQPPIMGGIRITNMSLRLRAETGLQLLATSFVNALEGGVILRYDGRAGAFADEFPDPVSCLPVDMAYGPDGKLYVLDVPAPGLGGCQTDWSVRRFNGQTGAFEEFVDDNANYIPILGDAIGFTFGPDGNLYITDGLLDSRVLRYQGPFGPNPGKLINEYVPSGNAGLAGVRDLVFGPDGNLYVLTALAVFRYQGLSGTNPGAFMDIFIAQGSGGVSADVRDLAFDRQGNLCLADFKPATIRCYQGPDGSIPGNFINAINVPAETINALAFAEDGKLYASVNSVNGFSGVLRFDEQSGEFLGNFASISNPRKLLLSVIPELPTTILGDFNQDDCVDTADLSALLLGIRNPAPNPSFDLNGDGVVNIVDARKLVLLFTNSKGASCAAPL